MTRTCQTSMVDMLVANPSLTKHIGIAEAFISHAWKYSFAAVVDAMHLWYETTREERLKKQSNPELHLVQASSPDTCFLWFDIGTVAQHASAQKAFPPNYFFNQFREGIESIGCTVIVLMPLFNPVPLTRAWCVWEIYCTINGGVLFETALSRSDQHLRDRNSIVRQMECHVEQAEAWSADDLTKILAACESMDGGCQHVNECIAGAFAFDQMRHTLSLRNLRNSSDKSYDQGENWDTILQLSGMELGSMALECLINHLKTPPMSKDQKEDENSSLCRFPIETLCFGHVIMSKEAFKMISAITPSIPSLKTLTFEMPPIVLLDDDCYQVLGDALPQLESLESLWVGTRIQKTETQMYPGFVHFLQSLLNLSMHNKCCLESITLSSKDKETNAHIFASQEQEQGEMNPIVKVFADAFEQGLGHNTTALKRISFNGQGWYLDERARKDLNQIVDGTQWSITFESSDDFYFKVDGGDESDSAVSH